MTTTNGESRFTSLRDRFRGFVFRRRRSLPAEDAAPPPRTLAVVVCVIISGILWLTITMQETHTILVPFETQVRNLPTDMALEDSLPRTVRAIVSGERIQLLRTVWDPPVVEIDARLDVVDVEEAVSVNNVRLQSVSPAVLHPRLGPRVTRKLPVRLVANIETAEGHDFLIPPLVTPDSVEVTGAERILDRIRFWPTRRFEHSGLKDTLMARVGLSDTLSSLISYRPREVLLTAVAGEFIGGYREVDVHVQGVPSGEVAVEPPTLRVRYSVLFTDYELAQNAPDFYAEVTYDEIRTNPAGRVTPRVHIPEDLEIRNVEPYPATVTYYRRMER